MSSSPTILVLGASGSVGRFLVPELAKAYPEAKVIALSRRDPPSWSTPLANVSWRRGDVFDAKLDDVAIDTVFSAGPLDGLVTWLERDRPQAARILALSSTSAHAKRHSRDAAERELALRLLAGESKLAAWCREHGARWTVLRPTLVYGAGADRSLTAVARIASRLGLFALPRSATGQRQPVHAGDVANALLAAANARETEGRAYDLPGGETLSYREMIARTLACLPGKPRLLVLPDALFTVAAAIARLLPAYRGATAAVIERMRADLAFDALPAALDFGYAPRVFAPEAGMFAAPASVDSSTR